MELTKKLSRQGATLKIRTRKRREKISSFFKFGGHIQSILLYFFLNATTINLVTSFFNYNHSHQAQSRCPPSYSLSIILFFLAKIHFQTATSTSAARVNVFIRPRNKSIFPQNAKNKTRKIVGKKCSSRLPIFYCKNFRVYSVQQLSSASYKQVVLALATVSGWLPFSVVPRTV